MERYLLALERELASVVSEPCSVDTIYLGGGTPSHLGAKSLVKLLSLVQQTFALTEQGEFTMEVNPEDLPGEIESTLRDSLVNRISLGIQSFDEAKLRSLDRLHSRDQIMDAVSSACDLAEHVSFDLIFAAPVDSLKQWQQDLQQAIALPCDHLSTYELTIEKGTAFFNEQLHQRLEKPEDAQCAEYYEQTISTLAGAGFEHYEVSSFARPGGRSRHNQVYWSGASYWAFGPGASSYVDGVRRTNHHSVATYLKRMLAGESPIAELERLSMEERAMDRLVFGLRRLEGIDTGVFQEQTGCALEDLVEPQTWQTLLEQNLLTREGAFLKLTKRGLMVSDAISQTLWRRQI